jgi:adenylate cyclase
MRELKLGLLGGFRLETADGQPVPVPTKKAKALLAYLALHGREPQPRAKLAHLLWEDSDEGQARESLRQALKLLRQALSPACVSALIAQGDAVVFEPAAFDIDVVDFHRLIETNRPQQLGSAAEQYRGQLLEGFDLEAPEFENWLAMERQRLNEEALVALEKLLAHHIANNAVDCGITVATQLLAFDPLRESAHRGLMELYCKQGRYAAALRQFRICAEKLKQELGVEPDAVTIALYRDIRKERDRPEKGERLLEPPAPDPVLEPVYPRAAIVSERPVLQLPDKPSIAVMPFQNMSGDPEQEYFADGMVEEIITALSRFKGLFVIARNSSFAFKGKAVDVKEVGRRLGVRCVLEGSVRKAAGKVRIAGQLIDAITGAHLWADRFERDTTDVFALQDEVTVAVVGAIQPKLLQTEIEMATRRPLENLTAYDLVLRAIQKYHPRTREGFAEAIRLTHRALDLDPRSLGAVTLAAICHLNNVTLGFSTDPQFDHSEAIRLARLALSLDENDERALSIAGLVTAWFIDDYETAIDFVDRAVTFNPNSFGAWNYRGWVYQRAGRYEEAILSFERGIRVSPLDPSLHNTLAGIGYALIELRRFDEAVAVSKKALWQNSSDGIAFRGLAAALAHLGRDAEAREAVARALEIDPAYTISGRIRRGGPTSFKLFFEGLRKAGVPE